MFFCGDVSILNPSFSCIFLFLIFLFRVTSTEATFWITGPPVHKEEEKERVQVKEGEQTIIQSNNPFRLRQLQSVVETPGLTLTANKEKYRIGEECLVLINPPFHPAEGTFVLGRESR